MGGTFPVRAAPAPRGWYRAPLVEPEGGELPPEGRPRIYIAPIESAADVKVLRASLAAASWTPPKWIPISGRGVAPESLRSGFLNGEPVLVPLTPPRDGPDRLARLLAWARETGSEVDLIPASVLWGPVGETPSLWNLLAGDPYKPPEWMRFFRVRRQERVRLVLGVPGLRSRLEAEALRPNDTVALGTYVRGQAVKALSLAERHVLGDQYKAPRLIVEQILGEPQFQDAAAAAGATKGLTREESLREVEKGLRELATGHNLFYMELFRRFTEWFCRIAYDLPVDVDVEEIERLRHLARESALVFVPSHKSNYDHISLYHSLFGAGFAPPHTAAGINMSFFPMNKILPGTGAYFIRRSFQNDPVYKEALRGFVHYLVQRRFHQEFFIEGGRTRSGKLLPPRYGMMRYVVDGVRQSDVTDVRVVPTAITYDKVLEVGDYVRENLGANKERESFRFLVGQIRKARRRKLGRIYIRFAEPVSLSSYLDAHPNDRLAVEKLSFHIATQINAAMRLTAVSVMSSVLLGAGTRALTRAELEDQTDRLLAYAGERDIGIARELEAGAKAAVDAGIAALEREVIATYEGGTDTVLYLIEGARPAASFYRNTVLHFFLVRAIAGLAERVTDDPGKLSGWALRIRDLLKFEFFFSERDPFVAEIEREHEVLKREREAGLSPFGAAGPRILLDFLESYWVVADALRTLPNAQPIADRELTERFHQMGRQRLLQDRVASPELLSNANFANALKLAVNLGAAERRDTGYVPVDTEALDTLAGDLEQLIASARR